MLLERYKMVKQKNKKAVSLMVAYVLLIVISISLAILVYGWLKFQANIQEIQKCPEDVSLVIQDYECNTVEKKINITVENKGLFNISGFKIKGTNNTAQDAIPSDALLDPLLSEYDRSVMKDIHYFYFPDYRPIKPNEVYNKIFSYSDIAGDSSVDLEKIQIEPFRIQKNKKSIGEVVLCDATTITLDVDC